MKRRSRALHGRLRFSAHAGIGLGEAPVGILLQQRRQDLLGLRIVALAQQLYRLATHCGVGIFDFNHGTRLCEQRFYLRVGLLCQCRLDQRQHLFAGVIGDGLGRREPLCAFRRDELERGDGAIEGSANAIVDNHGFEFVRAARRPAAPVRASFALAVRDDDQPAVENVQSIVEHAP